MNPGDGDDQLLDSTEEPDLEVRDKPIDRDEHRRRQADGDQLSGELGDAIVDEAEQLHPDRDEREHDQQDRDDHHDEREDADSTGRPASASRDRGAAGRAGRPLP